MKYILRNAVRGCLRCSECRTTEVGGEYVGTLSTTKGGKTCLTWSLVSPDIGWKPTLPDENYPDGSRAAAQNYCRNPGLWERGLWCYTTDDPSSEAWEKCDVPLCLGKCKLSGKNAPFKFCSNFVETFYVETILTYPIHILQYIATSLC